MLNSTLTVLDDYKYSRYCLLPNKDEMGYMDWHCLVNKGLFEVQSMFRWVAFISVAVVILKFFFYKLALAHEKDKDYNRYLMIYNIFEYFADIVLLMNAVFFYWFIKIGAL